MDSASSHLLSHYYQNPGCVGEFQKGRTSLWEGETTVSATVPLASRRHADVLPSAKRAITIPDPPAPEIKKPVLMTVKICRDLEASDRAHKRRPDPATCRQPMALLDDLEVGET